MALNKTVYAWTTFSTSNDGPVSFNLNNPGTLNGIVNEYPITSYPTSGTWANDKWYAAIYNTAPPYSLVTFNPTTGLRTSIGDIGVNINALSYNSVDSSMYGIGYDGTNSLLYSINTTSATSTYIGTITSRLIISLAINDAGVAYAVDRGDDVLGTINLTTAEFTSIGSIGFDANEPQNMEFDRETGELFMASYNTFGELRWVDKTTGNTLVIGQFQDGHKLTGFGIPYTSSKTLSLTCLLQGIYNGGGTMRKAQNETGDQFPGDTVDLITIELHNSVNYSTIDYSLNNISLSTNGICSHKVPGILNGSYYITVKHRNSIETTTPFPVSFGGGTINYNFTTDASKAFGGNLNHTPDGYWIIFSGDVNQDGTVDESDIINLNNQSSTFATGYIPDDVNGDGLIDAADMIIIDNNSSNLIFSMHPGN